MGSFRFRIGPFTVGRTGVRLSMWRGIPRTGISGGFSVPMGGKYTDRKGKERKVPKGFGSIKAGPLRWWF